MNIKGGGVSDPGIQPCVSLSLLYDFFWHVINIFKQTQLKDEQKSIYLTRVVHGSVPKNSLKNCHPFLPCPGSLYTINS